MHSSERFARSAALLFFRNRRAGWAGAIREMGEWILVLALPMMGEVFTSIYYTIFWILKQHTTEQKRFNGYFLPEFRSGRSSSSRRLALGGFSPNSSSSRSLHASPGYFSFSEGSVSFCLSSGYPVGFFSHTSVW